VAEGLFQPSDGGGVFGLGGALFAVGRHGLGLELPQDAAPDLAVRQHVVPGPEPLQVGLAVGVGAGVAPHAVGLDHRQDRAVEGLDREPAVARAVFRPGRTLAGGRDHRQHRDQQRGEGGGQSAAAHHSAPRSKRRSGRGLDGRRPVGAAAPGV
jgi:hypothetical protein